MDVIVAKIWVSVGSAIDVEAWTSSKLYPLSITFLWPLRCCKSRVRGIVCLSDPTVGIRYFLPGAGGMGLECRDKGKWYLITLAFGLFDRIR
jgi:hypothetical protein